jgi:hypothetical protein
MRLRELFEPKQAAPETPKDNVDGELKTIGVAFGRFNPPHRGHKAVWQAASTNPIWFVGTNESTSGPKDPLPYDIKLQAMAAVWPKVAGHVIPEQSLLTLASHIYERYGENVHLKVYTDEEWLVKTLQQYNGASDKPHGMYKFNQIDWARTERLASATNLRAAVRAGDREAFYKDMGIKPDVTITVDDRELPIFDVVSHYLNQYPEKTKKIAEANQTKISKRQQQSTRGVNTYSDAERWNADYVAYRLGMAVASTDGTITPNMDKKSWIGKSKATFPYTPQEQEMLNQAYKAVGAKVIDLNHGDMDSDELDSTNKSSVVAAPKKNKYGV